MLHSRSHFSIVCLLRKVYGTTSIPLASGRLSIQVYSIEWLTYQHIAVELAYLNIGACLPRDMMQQDSTCGHSLFFRSLPRSFHPFMATSASDYFVRVW